MPQSFNGQRISLNFTPVGKFRLFKIKHFIIKLFPPGIYKYSYFN